MGQGGRGPCSWESPPRQGSSSDFPELWLKSPGSWLSSGDPLCLSSIPFRGANCCGLESPLRATHHQPLRLSGCKVINIQGLLSMIGNGRHVKFCGLNLFRKGSLSSLKKGNLLALCYKNKKLKDLSLKIH